jgi:uncharacterized protein with HEPN domain
MERETGLLLDMLQAARELKKLSEGLSYDAFRDSRLHFLAFAKLIEIIGEAARATSEETRAAHPEIPWIRIIDMRNHLIHRYFNIQPVRIWDVVENHLDALIAQLEPLVPPESEPAPPDAT